MHWWQRTLQCSRVLPGSSPRGCPSSSAPWQQVRPEAQVTLHFRGCSVGTATRCTPAWLHAWRTCCYAGRWSHR